MYVSEDQYFKEKLITVLSDIRGKMFKCALSHGCGWTGSYIEAPQSIEDGTYSCPECGSLLYDYEELFLDKQHKKELYIIRED